MKKYYFFIAAFFFVNLTIGQILNFPDPNFRDALVQYGYDTSGDGEISQAEANAVTVIYLLNGDVQSIEGIQYFTNLVGLNADGNLLTSVDLGNLHLETVSLSSNLLTSVNLGDLANNAMVWLFDNQLTSITVTATDNHIWDLNVSNNPLTNLNLNFDSITNFTCENTQLSEISFANIPFLPFMFDSDFTISIKNNSNLTYLNLRNGTQETSSQLDVYFSNNPALNIICVDESEFAYYQTYAPNVSTYCAFNPVGNFNTILGNVTIDLNGNGCDVGDTQISNITMQIAAATTSGSTFTNIAGNYISYMSNGFQTVTPQTESPYFTFTPPSYTFDFTGYGNTQTANFCLVPNGVHPDLEVSIIPVGAAIPGFDADYRIICKNKGTEIQSGSLNFTFDDAVLDFISAMPTVFVSPGVLSWTFSNLAPFQTEEIEITLNVNSPQESPSVNMGDILPFSATIFSGNDEAPLDNVIEFDQVVLGSFDPNDKTCLEGNTVGPEMIGEYVHYVIRFENTGTYPAQNIVVNDMIDIAKFDVSTLIPISGSHPFETRITSTNKVEFIFENIMLPFDDATNDGYVAFKIKTLPSLVIGDTFSNNASIYFDYNFPIVTNTATTLIQQLGVNDFEFSDHFTLYPNPAKEVLNIKSSNGTIINSTSFYNTLGQLVLIVKDVSENSAIDVSQFKTGSYFIKIDSSKGNSVSKFIKE